MGRVVLGRVVFGASCPDSVEDEYHFTLVCPHYRMLRQKFLKDYYCHWPPMQKFESLLSSSSKKTINFLAKFVYFANKVRIS